MNNSNPRVKILIIILGLLAALDLIYLNIRIFIQPDTSFPENKAENLFFNKSTEQFVDKDQSKQNVIDYQWLNEKFLEATSSLTLQVNNLTYASTKPTTPQTIVTAAPGKESVKEYYIPLGSSSTKSTDWVDLSGVEAYVAPDNYGRIKEMYFEASMRIPTNNGSVSVRLKNVTDNTSLFESELSREGSSGGLVSSGKIPVPQSTKLYRVQIKSTLGAEAILDNARIKLFVW